MTKRHADTDQDQDQPPLHRPLPMPSASYAQPITAHGEQPCSSAGIIYPGQVRVATASSQLHHPQPVRPQVQTSQSNQTQGQNIQNQPPTSLNIQISQSQGNSALAAFLQTSQSQVGQQNLLTVASQANSLANFNPPRPNLLLSGQNLTSQMQSQQNQVNLMTNQTSQGQTNFENAASTQSQGQNVFGNGSAQPQVQSSLANRVNTQATQNLLQSSQPLQFTPSHGLTNPVQTHPTLAATLNQPIQGNNLNCGMGNSTISQILLTGQPLPSNQVKPNNGHNNGLLLNMAKVPANLANLPNSTLGVQLVGNGNLVGISTANSMLDGKMSNNLNVNGNGLSVSTSTTPNMMTNNASNLLANNGNGIAVMQSNGNITMIPAGNLVQNGQQIGGAMQINSGINLSNGQIMQNNGVSTLNNGQALCMQQNGQAMQQNGQPMTMQNNGQMNPSAMVVLKNGQVASNVGVPIIHNGNVVGFALDPAVRGRPQRPTMIQGVRVNGQPYMIAANGMVVPVLGANQIVGQGMALPQGYVQLGANGTAANGFMMNGMSESCNDKDQYSQNPLSVLSNQMGFSPNTNQSSTDSLANPTATECAIKTEPNLSNSTTDLNLDATNADGVEPCTSASLDVANNNALAILPMILFQQSQADGQPLPTNINWNEPKELMDVICTLCRYIYSQASLNETDGDEDNPPA
ncbi:unnamed protein product [Bursaphelenchus xylophilus]|uniref:(pine wood nematode) hypothetical protein n=1 Tax=Bursaphelenchus xylophilus TaxID=6326 RepID=A0A1I7RXN7_BURXY|nr:unnamed protein product [Bursaphelenchus xylophilus]CAG9126618.1 unnamed protein product [Bursaphelenchus xylophilus]